MAAVSHWCPDPFGNDVGRVQAPEKHCAVDLRASKGNGTLYVDMTSTLARRIWQHQTHVFEGFTDASEVTRLVWYEMHKTAETAITKKQVKKWNRAWKIDLIEKDNPDWRDLAEDLNA